MSLDLQRPRSLKKSFDALLVLIAVLGFGLAYYGFLAGGAWRVLGWAMLVCEGILAYGVFIEPKRLEVKRYRLASVKEPSEWIKIVFLSDFHAGDFRFRDWFARIAREVQALKPDLVLLGGDYVCYEAKTVVEIEPLKDLSAPLGKYFVMGNHDYFEAPEKISAYVNSLGYVDLTNKTAVIKRGGKKLELQGLDDPWYGSPMTVKRSSKEMPHLTLAHEPDMLLDFKEGETDLVLVGHTHSGQVRFPFIGSLRPIPAKLGRKVEHGEVRINGVSCIVGNGLGECDARPRLLARPQIVLVEVGI
ncbi:MAG: metallophosphoesterase [Patescibacteria group bacterium]|nr:metallophosphoesterase [Patescibacteria group bacterium]